MPPKIKVTKEQIIEAAFNLVKREGKEKLHARTIAKELNISTQPIFTSFSCMDDLIQEIKKKALGVYHQYINEGLKMEKPFKGTGIKYIEFAKNEPNLFYVLFMDQLDQSYQNINIDTKEHEEMQTQLILKTIGCSYDEAKMIQLESWIFVHGIACMIVTNTIHFDEEIISKLLVDFYKGLLTRR
jgi:hypothetical protein